MGNARFADTFSRSAGDYPSPPDTLHAVSFPHTPASNSDGSVMSNSSACVLCSAPSLSVREKSMCDDFFRLAIPWNQSPVPRCPSSLRFSSMLLSLHVLVVFVAPYVDRNVMVMKWFLFSIHGGQTSEELNVRKVRDRGTTKRQKKVSGGMQLDIYWPTFLKVNKAFVSGNP